MPHICFPHISCLCKASKLNRYKVYYGEIINFLNNKITNFSISSGFFPRDKPSEIPFRTASKNNGRKSQQILKNASWKIKLRWKGNQEKLNKNKSNTDFDIYISVVCFYKEWEHNKTEPNSRWSFYTFLAAKRIGEIFNQKEKERETPTEKLTK